MVSNESFTRVWLESFINPKAKKKIQPDLLEKMIHALALLDKLAQLDIEYIFKGGDMFNSTFRAHKSVFNRC